MPNLTALSIAQVIVYALLALPIFYILFRHGKRGLLGWLYLLIFCILRVTGNAIYLSHSTGNGATIISNIGISPLLLATMGILHEAHSYRAVYSSRLETTFQVVFHILVASAIGLIAAGASALTSVSPNDSGDSSLSLVKIGAIILLSAWCLLSVITIALVRPDWVKRRDAMDISRSRQVYEGVVLLYAVLASLVFTGIRVFYTVVTVFTRPQNLDPENGSLALRVCLQVVPELIVTVLFDHAGLWTGVVKQK